jgi:hypothetical protein
MVVADGIPMSLHINGAFCLCVCVGLFGLKLPSR